MRKPRPGPYSKGARRRSSSQKARSRRPRKLNNFRGWRNGRPAVPLQAPQVEAAGLQLLRRARNPATLLAGALLALLAFWLWANEPGPKREETPDPLGGPIDEEIRFPTGRTGSYTLETNYREVFDPGSSGLSPREPINNTGTITEEAFFRGLKYINFSTVSNAGPNFSQLGSSQFLTFSPSNPFVGGGVAVSKETVVTTGTGAGTGSTLTRTTTRRVTALNIGGQPFRFPSPVPGPGQPIPQPEPLEEPVPVPAPARAPARTLPATPPGTAPVPVPGGEESEEGEAAPFRSLSPFRAPLLPQRALVPQQARRLSPTGRLQPQAAPPPPPTPPGTTFLPGGVPLPTNGPRPTPQGTAGELGKLERKLEILLSPEGPLSLGESFGRVLDQLDNIRAELEQLAPGEPHAFGPGQYQLSPVCDRDSEGVLLPPRVASWAGGQGEFTELRQRLDALAMLLQHHKDLKQPTCAPRGNGPASNVTVHFESD